MKVNVGVSSRSLFVESAMAIPFLRTSIFFEQANGFRHMVSELSCNLYTSLKKN